MLHVFMCVAKVLMQMHSSGEGQLLDALSSRPTLDATR